MLFGKKKCPYCESEIDKAETTCPACGRVVVRNHYRIFNIQITWMPWYREIIVFLIGSLGLTIAALAVQIVMMVFKLGGDSQSLWVNFLGYLITLLSIGAVIFMHHKGLFKSFERWQPYLLGLAGLAAIYVFNVLYSSVTTILFSMEDNANETSVNSIILSMPVLSFFFVVIFGPLCEELTYRVGLFSFLYRIHVVVAYVATALIFALIHFDWTCFGDTALLTNELLNLPLYMFAGLTFCFLYHKWGLAASLTAHISNNLLSYVLILALSNLNG